MEQMSEVVPEAGYHQIQHFVSESPWDAAAVMGSVASGTGRLFSGGGPVALLVDESAHTKKGTKSVGVARQYNGRLGKVDNCQVAVYAALSSGSHYSLVDTRLYLPKEWVCDKARCKAAGIPAKEIKHRTKQELALEMITALHKQGTCFDWVGGDGLYGHDCKLRKAIAALGLLYMLDIHASDTVFLGPPIIAIPEKTGTRGRKPALPKADRAPVRVGELAKQTPAGEWKTYTMRNGAKGPLTADVHVREIYTWDGSSEGACKELLVVRRERNGEGSYEYKYSLSNADINKYSWLQLLQMQAQRFFVERGFEDAKDEAGMSQYQVRGWRAWHHHMALVMLSMLFVLEEKIAFADQFPLLSARDVREIIVRTYATLDDPIGIMIRRHKRRQDDINRRYRKT
jgi:SRSO17 transposase